MTDELVDLVDDADGVVGVTTRAAMRRHVLLHRAVFVAVVSSAGSVLVHRRSPDKDVWPGWWDLAVGGVVASGESYDEAARRELAEELGVGGPAPEPIGRGRYDGPEVRCLARVYRVCHDGPFRFADGEVVEASFVDRAELARRLRRDRFCPDSVELVVPHLGS